MAGGGAVDGGAGGGAGGGAVNGTAAGVVAGGITGVARCWLAGAFAVAGAAAWVALAAGAGLCGTPEGALPGGTARGKRREQCEPGRRSDEVQRHFLSLRV